jgi:hypothetical protein
MRAVLIEQRFDWALLAGAVAADLAWLLLAGIVFVVLFRQSRDRGLLLQVGE